MNKKLMGAAAIVLLAAVPAGALLNRAPKAARRTTLPSLAAGTAVVGAALCVEAYRKVRERLWLRREIELLPFPPKR